MAEVAAVPSAAPTGNAPQASAPAAPQSMHDRLKSALFAASEPQREAQAQPKADSAPTASQPESADAAPADSQVPAEADQGDAAADVTSDDAQSEDWQPSDAEELRNGLQWDEDRFMSLPFKVKIDGKEGTASLRDLVKSYQLDGHINQKLSSFDADRKSFETKVQQFEAERADKLLKLDAGYQTMERALLGEFQSVDWKQLAAESPTDYAAKLIDFQTRNAQLQDIGKQIAQEQQVHQAKQLEAHQAAMREQLSLLRAKAPEFADDAKMAATKADMVGYFEQVGFAKEEGETLWNSLADHRHMLMALDAMKYRKLQTSKPAVLNKVKAAPKLVRPGSQQSKDVVANLAGNRERETLRQSGKVTDAKPVLKRLLFGG